MADAIVTASGIGYLDEAGNAHTASRGETVELTAAEFERLSALNAVAKPASAQAKQAKATATPGPVLPSEQAGAPGHPETAELE